MTTYISLGGTCAIAWNLQRYGLRDKAFPFDWLRAPDFYLIVKTIKDDFDKFFSELKITSSTSTAYPLSTDKHDFPMDEKTSPAVVVQNIHKIKFCHDFKFNNGKESTIENLNLSDVVDKYNRRIRRFYEILQQQQTIHFIREDHHKQYTVTPSHELIEVIEKKNDKLDFKLTVLVHIDKGMEEKIVKYSHHGHQITVRYVYGEFTGWQRENLDWTTIFESEPVTEDTESDPAQI